MGLFGSPISGNKTKRYYFSTETQARNMAVEIRNLPHVNTAKVVQEYSFGKGIRWAVDVVFERK